MRIQQCYLSAMLNRRCTLNSSFKLGTAVGVAQSKHERENVPGFLPDSDLFAALRRLSLEAATFVGSWGGRHRQWQREVGLILGGERRQEAHLCTVYQTWKQEGIK